jgi:hypothetical protein
VHIQTLSWAKLPRKVRDDKLLALGISLKTLSRIRSFEPRERIIEAARIAFEFDPEPNSDFIEYIAGYHARSGLYHHFRNMQELCDKIGIIRPANKLEEIQVKSTNLDLAEVIPKSLNHYDVHVEECAGLRKICVWQKVNGGMRSVILNRQVSKLLFWSGVLLYITEGTKFSKSSNNVQIANARPGIHRLFLSFLEELGIDLGRIRARIQLHDLADEDKAQRFWDNELGISPKQYYKPMLSNSHGMARRKTFTMHLQFSNSMLCALLSFWGENLDQIINHVRYPSK